MNKIGRNDPCACGSGKKYKHCCANKPPATQVNSQAQQQQLANALLAAHQFLQAGQPAQAEAICHQILQAIPSQADALHLLGVIALRDGNIEQAVRYLSQAVRLNRGNPQFIANLGFAYHEQGQLDLAVNNYRKAIALNPDYVDAHYNLHAALLDSKNLKPSITCLEQVLRLNPNDMDARFMLGLLLDYAGEATAAETHFRQAEQSAGVFKARLDAWCYIKETSAALPPIMGSMLQTFSLAMNAAKVKGLALEFGVRFGTSIRQIAALAKQEVHGFDSFEGLPEVWHHEPKGSYTTKGVIPAVPQNVKLHAGWFEDTLPGFLQEHSGDIRFINIDCDIYSSTKTVLTLLASRIVPGTVIVFDEYIGNEHWREDEFKAFQEAVAHNSWNYEYLCFSIFTKQVAVRILK